MKGEKDKRRGKKGEEGMERLKEGRNKAHQKKKKITMTMKKRKLGQILS